MSGRFAPVTDSDLMAIAAADLTGPQTRVYLALLIHRGRDGKAWPKQGTLAKLAGVSTRSVGRAIDRLVEHGLVTRAGHRPHGVLIYGLNRSDAQGSELPDRSDAQGSELQIRRPGVASGSRASDLDTTLSASDPTQLRPASSDAQGSDRTHQEQLNNQGNTPGQPAAHRRAAHAMRVAVTELLDLPGWLARVSSRDEREEQTTELVDRYCERWPAESASLWARAALLPIGIEDPAAWAHAHLKGYGTVWGEPRRSSHKALLAGRWQEAADLFRIAHSRGAEDREVAKAEALDESPLSEAGEALLGDLLRTMRDEEPSGEDG